MDESIAMVRETTVEAGVPNSSYNVWLGLFAPDITLPAIVDKLNREAVAVLRTSETVEKLAKGMGVVKELVKTAKIPAN